MLRGSSDQSDGRDVPWILLGRMCAMRLEFSAQPSGRWALGCLESLLRQLAAERLVHLILISFGCIWASMS